MEGKHLDPSMHGDITWRSCREIPDVRPVSGQFGAPLYPGGSPEPSSVDDEKSQNNKKERLYFDPPMPAESVECHSLGHCYVPLTATLARTRGLFAGPQSKHHECMTPAN